MRIIFKTFPLRFYKSSTRRDVTDEQQEDDAHAASPLPVMTSKIKIRTSQKKKNKTDANVTK